MNPKIKVGSLIYGKGARCYAIVLDIQRNGSALVVEMLDVDYTGEMTVYIWTNSINMIDLMAE